MPETLLSPNECLVGHIGSVTTITLVIPMGRHDGSFLVVPTDARLTAFFLEGEFAFSSFDCTENESWRGLLVPNVDIELDTSSVFDPGESHEVLGSVVRKENTLSIVAKQEKYHFGPRRIAIIGNLPAVDGGLAAGFKTWCIKIGEGTNRRALKTIRVGQQSAAA
jgi:hypothetical protein